MRPEPHSFKCRQYMRTMNMLQIPSSTRPAFADHSGACYLEETSMKDIGQPCRRRARFMETQQILPAVILSVIAAGPLACSRPYAQAMRGLATPTQAVLESRIDQTRSKALDVEEQLASAVDAAARSQPADEKDLHDLQWHLDQAEAGAWSLRQNLLAVGDARAMLPAGAVDTLDFQRSVEASEAAMQNLIASLREFMSDHADSNDGSDPAGNQQGILQLRALLDELSRANETLNRFATALAGAPSRTDSDSARAAAAELEPGP